MSTAVRRRLLLAWALVAIALCLQQRPWRMPITGDNQLYFFASERAASGVPPHLSFVDSKNQLAVLVQAAAIGAGRVLGIDDVASTRACSIAFFAASVALVMLVAGTLTGSVTTAAVAALALVAARGVLVHAAAGSSVKITMMTLALLAHAAMMMADRAPPRAAWHVVAGLAAGAAFACWQPALVVVIAVVVEALFARGGGWRRAAVVLASAIAAVLAYELYFVLHGALGEQLRQAYWMPLGSLHPPRRLLRSLLFVLHEGAGAHKSLRIAPLAFVLVAGAAVVALLRSPRAAVAAVRERCGALSLLVAAIGATAFTLYDHQGIPDLFLVHPYFAVCCALLASAATQLPPARDGDAGRARMPAAPVFLAAALALQMFADSSTRRSKAYDLDAQRALAASVRDLQAQHGSVWAYGALHLLGLAHLDNHVATALFWDDVRDELAGGAWRPLRDGRLPAIIVDSRGLPEELHDWRGRNYVEITTEPFASQAITVWRRRERPSEGE